MILQVHTTIQRLELLNSLSYIKRWADGSDIPRVIPSTAINFFEHRGIRHVLYDLTSLILRV